MNACPSTAVFAFHKRRAATAYRCTFVERRPRFALRNLFHGRPEGIDVYDRVNQIRSVAMDENEIIHVVRGTRAEYRLHIGLFLELPDGEIRQWLKQVAVNEVALIAIFLQEIEYVLRRVVMMTRFGLDDKRRMRLLEEYRSFPPVSSFHDLPHQS